jgi:hypothetical protein
MFMNCCFVFFEILCLFYGIVLNLFYECSLIDVGVNRCHLQLLSSYLCGSILQNQDLQYMRNLVL